MLFENEMEFAEAVRDTVEEYLPEEYRDYSAMIQTTKKNNGVEMIGLTLKGPASNIAPVIYVKNEFELVNAGEISFDQAVRNLVDVAIYHMPEQDFDVEATLEYENAKDKIIPKVIATEKNEERLSRIPHREVAPGLSEIYVLALNGKFEDGIATIEISNEIAARFGVTEEELNQVALDNQRRINPPSLQSMNDFIKDMVMPRLLEQTEGNREQAEIMFETMMMPMPMYIVSNQSKIGGAATMLDTEFMNKVAEQLGVNAVYCLPSSVHECLVLPPEGIDPDYLSDMVRQVNSTEVRPEEQLTDFAYGYDAIEQKFYKADDAIFQQLVETASEDIVATAKR